MKGKNSTVSHLLLLTLITTLIISAQVPTVRGQKIVPEIKTILQTLPLEKQEWLQNFHEMVEIYIKDHEWHDKNYGGEITINMEWLLHDISTSAEEAYRTNLLISNGMDIQYFDRRCRFKYRHGEQIKSDNLEQLSLIHLVDFYVYLILGGEFDKLGTLEGTVFYEKARDIAQQAKYGLGRYIDGWDLRERLVLGVLSDDNKPYREMVDYYYYSLSMVGENIEVARQYGTAAVNIIVDILSADPKHDSCLKFLDAHRSEIINLFKDSKGDTVLSKLAAVDPENAEAYIKSPR